MEIKLDFKMFKLNKIKIIIISKKCKIRINKKPFLKLKKLKINV